MGEALKKVQDAYAAEVIKNNPDREKLQRLKDAIATLGAGGG